MTDVLKIPEAAKALGCTEACVVKLDDETWAKLHELNGDAWLDEGHRELVIDTMLNYALPHYQERAKDGFC